MAKYIQIIFLMTLMLFCKDAYSQEGLLNKLLAPGPLIEAHKDLEHKDCLLCHTARQGIPDNKCLDCHKEIKKSVDLGNTYHGNQKKSCFECHADHKGRSYDSTKFDTKTFNHNETGYKLIGKHAQIKCEECHTEKRTKKAVNPTGIRFFGQTKATCNECHKSDDIHFFQGSRANQQCSECHGQISWKQDIKFDHGRDAKYNLIGRHSKLECKSCHVKQGASSVKYNWPNLNTQKCLACHTDQHKGKMSAKYQGGRCETCHSQQTWRIGKFQHQVTGYPLRGKHAILGCEECHKQSSQLIGKPKKLFQWQGLNQTCISCHQDYHAFDQHVSQKLGALKDCLRCHNETSWKQGQKFDHSFDTRFEIDGKHLENSCFECHLPKRGKKVKNPKQRIYSWPKLETKTCEVCHKSPHYNSFPPELLKKRCSECHVTTGWNVLKGGKNGAFDHNTTRFPLTGKHRSLACEQCHVSQKKNSYKFPNADKKFCVSCHDNVHKRQFSSEFSQKSCAECHTTTNFTKLKPFNHNKTEFPLTGYHQKISQRCDQCHIYSKQTLPTKPVKKARLFKFKKVNGEYCISCHGSVHKQQFSEKFTTQSCTECHVTTTFKKRKKFDHNETDFVLKGKHRKTDCTECHKKTKKVLTRDPLVYAGRYQFPQLEEKSCATCHNDPHRGSYGPRCADCHNERSWKSSYSFHESFELSEVHYTLSCEECHQGKNLLAGQSEECHICHTKDDIHRGSLPNCYECHRQSFWEVTKFKHSESLFPIRGSHRALNCNECHYNGIYQGLPSDCLLCHVNDAEKANHGNNAGFENCADCHNEFSFGNPQQ